MKSVVEFSLIMHCRCPHCRHLIKLEDDYCEMAWDAGKDWQIGDYECPYCGEAFDVEVDKI